MEIEFEDNGFLENGLVAMEVHGGDIRFDVFYESHVGFDVEYELSWRERLGLAFALLGLH